MKEFCGDDLKIKAAGGIRTYEDFKALLDMGVERMGINTKSAIEIVTRRKPPALSAAELSLFARTTAWRAVKLCARRAVATCGSFPFCPAADAIRASEKEERQT